MRGTANHWKESPEKQFQPATSPEPCGHGRWRVRYSPPADSRKGKIAPALLPTRWLSSPSRRWRGSIARSQFATRSWQKSQFVLQGPAKRFLVVPSENEGSSQEFVQSSVSQLNTDPW